MIMAELCHYAGWFMNRVSCLSLRFSPSDDTKIRQMMVFSLQGVNGFIDRGDES
jgi:hypothetical protein